MIYPKQAIPCVAGLCIAENNGNTYIQIQERNNSKYNGSYNGLIEIPVGVLDIEFEDLHTAVIREVFEESGLHVLEIIDSLDNEYIVRNDTVRVLQPFCVTQITEGVKPWVCNAFLCRVEYTDHLTAQIDETRNPRWVTISELRDLIQNPELFFPLTFPVLQKYLNEKALE